MNTSGDYMLSELIRNKAKELGFDLCGFAPSHTLGEHSVKLKNWCSSGMNAGMDYLATNIEKRCDPQLLVPNARSVVVTGLSYYSTQKQGGKGVPVISRYAYGSNYHDVIKKKLNSLLDHIKSNNPDTDGRAFVDSAPVLEKAWASEAGLGWPGKHSVIINREIGSFFFIGILIITKELVYDEPFRDELCGSCRLCIDHCPTSAINGNRTIDARKCIAYQTIENSDPVPAEITSKMDGRVFGCDRCQEVCPWNMSVKQHTTPEFIISDKIVAMTKEDWLSLTPELFNVLFKSSAVKRSKYDRLMKNIKAASATL